MTGRAPRRYAPLRLAYDLLLRPRRTRRIGELLAPLLPDRGTVLDIGCGDGTLTARLEQLRPGVRFVGVDVAVQPRQGLELHAYDGRRLPFDDRSFDVALLCAVLHHLDDPLPLLAEAVRVARRSVVLLDHRAEGLLDRLALGVVDWPGNVPFGVYTPYHFLSGAQWEALFARVGLRREEQDDEVRLFGGGLLERAFGGRRHFVARLAVPGQ